MSSIVMSLWNEIYRSIVVIYRPTAHHTSRDPPMTRPIQMSGQPREVRQGERKALSAKRNPPIVPEKSAYGRNPVPRDSRIRVSIHFCFTMDHFAWTSKSENATKSHMTSSMSVAMIGIRISIEVRSGSQILSTIDMSAILPLILEETLRYSSHLQSFSSVFLRNTLAIPELNASLPSDIHIAANTKLMNPSAKIKVIDEMIRSIFDIIRACFCHHRSAIIPAGTWKSILMRYPIPVQRPI